MQDVVLVFILDVTHIKEFVTWVSIHTFGNTDNTSLTASYRDGGLNLGSIFGEEEQEIWWSPSDSGSDAPSRWVRIPRQLIKVQLRVKRNNLSIKQTAESDTLTL